MTQTLRHRKGSKRANTVKKSNEAKRAIQTKKSIRR